MEDEIFLLTDNSGKVIVRVTTNDKSLQVSPGLRKVKLRDAKKHEKLFSEFSDFELQVDKDGNLKKGAKKNKKVI